MADTVDAASLKGWLADGGEIALVDVGEAGQFAAGHPFLAASLPYSRFELDIAALVPRRGVRLVVCDHGAGVAERAAGRAEALGYRRVFVLGGGVAAWARAGYTLYEGVNVPSKTFGELVEHERATPHVTADELAAMRAAGEDFVLVDGRTFAEFQRFAIPGGISCPNGELALRIDDLAPDPRTRIVVNCAGRTRSIIGAQTLIDLGVPNPVVALENGTQGWVLAGHRLETGASRRHGRAMPADVARRRERAGRHARARGVGFVGAGEVSAWLGDEGRTTYVFDVRSGEERADAPAAGLVHAPGGQLVQASDQWVGVRNARIVVADEELVRAPMVAAWLRELGFEAHALAGGVAAAADIVWPDAAVWPAVAEPAPISAGELKDALGRGDVRAIDLRSSAAYRAGHVAAARWSIRPNLLRDFADAGGMGVLIADLAGIAGLAAGDLAEAGFAECRLLAGTPVDWAAAGLAIEATPKAPADAECLDFVSFTHGRHHGDAAASRRYLEWELGLIGQLDAAERAVFRIAPGRGAAFPPARG